MRIHGLTHSAAKRISLWLAVPALAVALLGSCRPKPALTDADHAFIATTLDLMRVRAAVGLIVDSAAQTARIDSVYRVHHTTKAAYLSLTAEIGRDAERTDLVYKAISDSIGIKN